MTVQTINHPAKFSEAILELISKVVATEVAETGPVKIVDVFAGVGGIHSLAGPSVTTIGVELEPEWAAAHRSTIVGDATRLPFGPSSFDIVCTSPSYGNRLADSYDGRDGSKRSTYRLSLGRPLTDGSGSAMQWGATYRKMHSAAWSEAHRVLAPGGLMIVNVSNHVRAGELIRVAEWHLSRLLHSLILVATYPVVTPRHRFGANHELRADCEHVFILRKPGGK